MKTAAENFTIVVSMFANSLIDEFVKGEGGKIQYKFNHYKVYVSYNLYIYLFQINKLPTINIMVGARFDNMQIVAQGI